MKRETWGSRFGFVLAAAGSAIGLGNIWKFPFKTGVNGGAAFVIVYLICVVVVGLPIIIAEIIMGRRTQRNPLGGYRMLKPNSHWFLAGGLGIASGFVILSFYSVVGGWTIAYILKAVTNRFAHYANPAQAGLAFERFAANPVAPVLFHAIFMFLCMFIVIRGVRGGIERWNSILMPALFAILILLALRGLTLPGASRGLEFLFKPDFSKFQWGHSTLVALGHAFFTLSIGMGAMFTYGSYLSKDVNVPLAALHVVILDTLIALIAGLAIFTSVFAAGLDPAAGAGLVFHTLPIVFQKMPGGHLFGILFFSLLLIAALTSAISLLEVVCAYFIDEKLWSRRKTVIIMGSIIFLLGIPAALSFGPLANVKIFFGYNFFEFADGLSSNYMLPIGGMLLAIFVGWVWGTRKAVEECRKGDPTFRWGTIWSFSIRYLAPVAVGIVIIQQTAVLKWIGLG